MLLAEDDDAQRKLLARQAHSLGWQYHSVDGGEALISVAASASAHGRPFDVLVVDWQMPDLDRLSALASLRQRLPRQEWPAAVVISHHELDRLRRAPHAELASALLIKPVNSSALFDAVNQSLASLPERASRLLTRSLVGSGEYIWLQDLHILIVDDSTLNLDVARKEFELEGARVVTCSGGQEALHEALAAGMSDFLPKPLEPQRLIRCLRRHVERYRGQPIPLKVRSPGKTNAGEKIGIAGIDAAAIMPTLLGDVSLILSMIKRLLAEFADIGSTPDAALPARLHKLNGSTQVVGAMALARATAELEHSLRHALRADWQAQLSGLAQQLHELATAAEPMLRREADRQAAKLEREAQQVADPLDLAALEELRELIDQQNTRAAQRIEELTTSLQASLGAKRLARLRAALLDYDFQAATDALNP